MPLPSNSPRLARPLLGTLVEIKATGAEPVLSAAVDAAFVAVAEVHRLMSFHDPDSDVSRLNRMAYRQSVEVAPATWTVLAAAREFSEASDGAFDITVAPRLVTWGYLPAVSAHQASARRNGYRCVELLPGCLVRFLDPVLIDLGGIAKGYAVDRACATLEAHGIFDYVINAGGDLRVGATPEAIYVRHPGSPGDFFPLASITRAAVATSAAYFAGKRWRNTDVHPLVSPETGAPALLRGSVSVLAHDCLTSDALTKVAAVLGDEAESVLRRFGAEACLLSQQGERRILCEPAFPIDRPNQNFRGSPPPAVELC